jgi:DNA (cytosine-5)-methyltransferase 1
MSLDQVYRQKLARLKVGAQPRVLDLFAGCGGISLGFQAAGFEIKAALEFDPLAAASHALNFHRSDDESAAHAEARDITQLEPAEFADELGLGDIAAAFDIVVGGPPCQAYARVGRAKLREVVDHPEAFKIDPRANLYMRYLHYVRCTKPLALVMENVPDILNFGGHNIVQEIVDVLEEDGYVARYSLINSAHHGVPQMRDRVFMIAVRKELAAEPYFPVATHHCDLPSGYAGTRSVALKHVRPLLNGYYVEPDIGDSHLPPAVTAREALADLPPITLHQRGLLKRGARRFTELSRYRGDIAPSNYAKSMRKWAGFESNVGVYDHVLRCLPRDTEIFRHMSQGDEYPAAHRVATNLFIREARRRGLREGTEDWKSLHRTMVPPYPVGSFPNRWWKLREGGPSRTLLAHLGKDTYSHIHYDSAQARVITVREAARLQSFPDGFTFAGTMNPAFRQIGNAVPPLMAKAIGEVVMDLVRTGITSRKPQAA